MEVTHKHVEAGAHGSEQEKMSRSSWRRKRSGAHGSSREKELSPKLRGCVRGVYGEWRRPGGGVKALRPEM